MDCSVAEKNINSFLKGTLKGNALRRTYYHIEGCEACRDVLLDEFSFYVTFNDLDGDLDFNYKKKMEELLKATKDKLENGDALLQSRYIVTSILLCFLFLILLIIAIRVVYG